MPNWGGKPARIATIPDLGGSPTGDWFIAAMLDQGLKPDRDFVVVQSAVQPGQIDLDEAVARVVTNNPDVIFAGGVSMALSARRATTTIPVVMWVSGYPVEAGLAESRARPGKITSSAVNRSSVGRHTSILGSADTKAGHKLGWAVLGFDLDQSWLIPQPPGKSSHL